MALFKKSKINQEEPKKENQTLMNDEEICKILIKAFKIPQEHRAELVENISTMIKKATTKEGHLNYEELIYMITEDYQYDQKVEALGHQLLGIFIAKIFYKGNPLDIRILEKVDDE